MSCDTCGSPDHEENSAFCGGGSLYCSKCGYDRPYCECPDTHFNSEGITYD